MGWTDERRICPQCGAVGDSIECPACGHLTTAPSPRLLAVSRLRDAEVLPLDPAAVRLVREYKGPTTRDLDAVPDEAIDLLPGRVLSALVAANARDYAQADRCMDHALGLLLPGPGHRRRGARPGVLVWLLRLLWLLWGALGASLLWWGLT